MKWLDFYDRAEYDGLRALSYGLLEMQLAPSRSIET
jgi:hypothetical protein